MSALDELKKKEERTDLDGAVIGIAYYEKQATSFSGRATTVYSEKAAAELLALREELSTAKACLELSEGELRFTKSELTDAKARAKTAEENWHKNEARLGKLQMVATAFMNEVPESEINLAREILGNSNTRITLEKLKELEAALKGAA